MTAYDNNDTANTTDFFETDVKAFAKHEMTFENDDLVPSESAAPSEETEHDSHSVISSSDGDGGNGPIKNGCVLPGFGHNRRAYVRDLILDPRVHERRSVDPDELKRKALLVANNALHRPVPVVEKDGVLCYADSSVFCQALLAADADAMVDIEIVSEPEGLAIRFRDNAKRTSREPMAKVRLSSMLVDAGFSGEDAGRLLGVKAARISQLVAVARTEAEFEALAALVTNRSMVTPRFWSSIHDTRVARGKVDEKEPKNNGLSRVQKFEADIDQIISDGQKVTTEDISKRLNLNGSRTARNAVRMHGTPVSRPDLKLRLHFDEGRRNISVDPSYPKSEFKALVNMVAELLIQQQKKRDGSATKN